MEDALLEIYRSLRSIERLYPHGIPRELVAGDPDAELAEPRLTITLLFVVSTPRSEAGWSGAEAFLRRVMEQGLKRRWTEAAMLSSAECTAEALGDFPGLAAVIAHGPGAADSAARALAALARTDAVALVRAEEVGDIERDERCKREFWAQLKVIRERIDG